jgi:hypothetical protein
MVNNFIPNPGNKLNNGPHGGKLQSCQILKSDWD